MLLTLTLNMLSHPFSGKLLKGPPQVKPALFTRTWILSSRLQNSAMRASQPAFDYINYVIRISNGNIKVVQTQTIHTPTLATM